MFAALLDVFASGFGFVDGLVGFIDIVSWED